MAVPTLVFYSATPFAAANKVTPMDSATGDGINPDVDLLNKSGILLADMNQVETQKFFRSAGYTLVGNTVTFDSVPAINARILLPGSNGLLLRVYDKDDVPGELTPREFAAEWWLIDNETIETLQYIASGDLEGIEVSMYDFFGGTLDALAEWFQLAPGLPDGTEGTYEAAGDPLYFRDIKAKDFLLADTPAPATVIELEDASEFEAADYIRINPSDEDNTEIRRILSIDGNELTLSGAFDLDHLAGEPVFHIGYKGFLKVIIPLDATDNEATILANVALRRRYDFEARF